MIDHETVDLMFQIWAEWLDSGDYGGGTSALLVPIRDSGHFGAGPMPSAAIDVERCLEYLRQTPVGRRHAVALASHYRYPNFSESMRIEHLWLQLCGQGYLREYDNKGNRLPKLSRAAYYALKAAAKDAAVDAMQRIMNKNTRLTSPDCFGINSLRSVSAPSA